MNKEDKRYLKSKMNEYANKFCKRNKIDEKSYSAHLIRKVFKSAFMFSYKLFMNRAILIVMIVMMICRNGNIK